MSVWRMLLSVCVLIGLALSAVGVKAEPIVYQDGLNDPFTAATYSGTEDTAIIPHVPNNNYGGSIGVTIGQNDDNPRRALLRFDVTSLAGEYISINSATLKLYVNSAAGVNTANAADLYQLVAANAGWVEGTSSGAAQSGESTWNNRNHPSTAWNSGTAGTAAADYAGLLTSVAFDSSTSGWVSFTLPTSLVADWAAGNNSGMLMRANNESSAIDSKLIFHSSEFGTGSLRPKLELDITPVPEPGSVGLLALGSLGLLLVGRRRRAKR